MVNRKLNDKDNPEWTARDFARARPGRDVLPPGLAAKLEKRMPGQRGPGRRPAKVAITFRLDPDVVAGIKASGEGYGRRVNETLRKAFAFVAPRQARRVNAAPQLEPAKIGKRSAKK